MFERPHHRRVAAVLDALDADFFAANRCYFGGGTAIALRYGEYRESVDVDFIVSDVAGYRAVRQRAAGATGVLALARPGALLRQLREVRADQYGVRTLVAVNDDVAIKLEIVLEARISLEQPDDEDRVGAVSCLTPLDMATCKLLANSDRWADDAVHSRDVIDLAMMNAPRPLLQAATKKAELAYGDAVVRDLTRAIAALRDRRGRLEACMAALQMTSPRALVWKRLKRLVS